ncbi:bifunctional hydroxymethylpyrimidine kinase/phosphomethylpyrimidine kinase [Pelotalea chapellei]|uniref:Thiamine-phosphate synthase n=1 Tax=Pelotalea chapellei TaxID=44671 RepID=A0ABS5UAA7_9BACT|nr:bifunctional hydroxymethylpyrimidine kinase/phosphomethylpyrimidine kinase [Pelotalea chapellei]MBT1072576.1 bifunctional hydroxymethylpyrimidine kinase/phosphomethylpyrimidine kinase [Pelotalea chapellei]
MSNNGRHFRLVVNKTTEPFSIAGVYLITDQNEDLVERVRLALRGGVTALQYRAKDKKHEECLTEARVLQQLCREFGTTFIVNDSVSLARELDADGVHLGQDDGSVSYAREQLGDAKIIGKSTHDLNEALQAEKEGADYIGFGAMYPTESKLVTHIPGTQGLAQIRSEVNIPVVGIGGITVGNACRVIDAGADAVAVISSVLSHPRPDMAASTLRLLFNRQRPFPRGSVLTVAGSDSGGGAGIQADLKTITLLGSYGASVLTALTAQNTRGVASIHGLPPSFVTDQLGTVLSDIPIDIIKTGMLHTPAIISAVAEYLLELDELIPLVIDPVMVAKGGAALMDRDAISVFCTQLLPQAYLLTPNIPEAEKLTGLQIHDESDMEQAARKLQSMGAANVLLKGGHLTGPLSTDLLFDGCECHLFPTERIFTSNTHGTGCSYASAIATFLAQGKPLVTAIEQAKGFITTAIRLSRSLGKGHSPINHYLGAVSLFKNGKE